MTTPMMEIITQCENYLGWQPAPHLPIWQARAIEIAKLNRAIKAGPRNHTLDNLCLALNYARHKRLRITSPSALLRCIPDALALAHIAPTMSSTARQVEEAIRWEQGHDDGHSLRWIYRLVRSQGSGRDQVLTEWKDAGRG